MVASDLIFNSYSGYNNCTRMMSNDICPPLPSSAFTKCKKDILVRGDVTDDVTDIVEKFIKVAHENNKVRENARENIRKKLAMEAGKEKMDSCDLQICFVNEFASDDDDADDDDDDEHDLSSISKQDIAKSNISKRVSQIIIPLAVVNQQNQNPSEEGQLRTGQEDSTNQRAGNGNVMGDSTNQIAPNNPFSEFQNQVANLQLEARENLIRSRDDAKIKIQDSINLRKKCQNKKLFSLLGLPPETKLSRRILSKLNVAQLQLIQNDYLARIKNLNEELVSLLVKKDDLTVEQDALMTDIEDLSEFVNMKR